MRTTRILPILPSRCAAKRDKSNQYENSSNADPSPIDSSTTETVFQDFRLKVIWSQGQTLGAGEHRRRQSISRQNSNRMESNVSRTPTADDRPARRAPL